MNTLIPQPGEHVLRNKRFLSRDDCLALRDRILSMTKDGGDTEMEIESRWSGDVRWARNRISAATDRQSQQLLIRRSLDGADGVVHTNQIDNVSLESAIRSAERAARFIPTEAPDVRDVRELPAHLKTHIWSDTTFAQSANSRTDITVDSIQHAERAGMLSAGYIHMSAKGVGTYATTGLPMLYYPRTYAECSITVRDPKGIGSGWAGVSSYDWDRLDPKHIAEVAQDKCLRSRNPVAVEPGRYVAILESQATFDLIDLIVRSIGRESHEGTKRSPQFDTAFADGRTSMIFDDLQYGYGLSKIGQQILDPRISLIQEATHPDLGMPPFFDAENALRDATWIKDGVINAFGTDRWYAKTYWNENEGARSSGAFRMTGGDTSLNDMVATTKRGIYVTRFTNIQMMHTQSLLVSGYTSDGLWLIEDGKITKPIKNFRFTDSPLFAFNNVDQLGVPTPVFSPGVPAIIPPVKVRDFNFSSLSDAV